MILSGRLTDWSVAELLQILQITGKSASLRIEGPDRAGTLFFDGGKIVDAALSTGTSASSSRERIVEAVYVLQLLPDGTFAVGNETSPDGGDGLEVDEAMKLAGQYLNAERELAESGLLKADALRLTPQVEDPVTLPPEDWDLLARIAGAFTLDALEASLGRARAVSFIAALRRLGLIDPAEVDPSELDALSQRTAPEPAPAEAAASEPAREEPAAEQPASWWMQPEEAEEEKPSAEVIELEALDPEEGEPTTEEKRRQMRALITPPDTTLVPGVLDDLRTRFRNIEQADE